MSYPLKLKFPKMRGVAVIVALFIMAVVAAIAIAMMSRLQRDTHSASLIAHSVQADLYAQGSVAWAIDTLRTNWERKQNGRLVDVMPVRAPVREMNGYKIVSMIEDAQGRFNLNNLTATDYIGDFQHLIQVVDPNISPEQALLIAQNTAAWVSPGNENNPIDKFYSNQNPPYRAAHRIMGSVSELRLVKGMTPKLYNELLPNVIALPASYPINPQTATVPVLVSLGPTMDLASAKAIDEHRKTTPFVDLNSFLNFDVVQNHPLRDPKLITATSTVFLVTTEVAIGDQQLLLYTLLMRTPKNDKSEISVLWQSKGSI